MKFKYFLKQILRSAKLKQSLANHKVLAAFFLVGVLLASCSGTGVIRQIPLLTKARVQSVITQSQLVSLEEQQAIAEFFSKIKIHLPPAKTTPIPAPPTIQLSAPLGPHQIFGFAPYWTLSNYQSFPYADVTTFAYFGLDVNPNGTINESSDNSGFNGYQSQDLVNLIDLAHQNSDRVVLSVTCFGTSQVASLVSNVANAKTLASQVIPLMQAKSFDGLNIDFEGQGSSYRDNLTNFVYSLVSQIKEVNPNWQITIDTYGSSAEDPNGPFDINALNQYVDGFFVMAYDMDNPQVPSPTAPLSNVSPSDLEALATYTQVVPPSKIILGIPYYGYDWPTSGPNLGSSALGPPTPVSYAQIVSAGYPTYWDPVTSTPWTSYHKDGTWHQIFFDNPASVELKVALAATYQVAGVGVWALGMDGNDPLMLEALLGQSPPVKLPPLGPPPTPQQSTPSSNTPNQVTSSTCINCQNTTTSSTITTTTTEAQSTTTCLPSTTTTTTTLSSTTTTDISQSTTTTSTPSQTTTTINVPTTLINPNC